MLLINVCKKIGIMLLAIFLYWTDHAIVFVFGLYTQSFQHDFNSPKADWGILWGLYDAHKGVVFGKNENVRWITEN